MDPYVLDGTEVDVTLFVPCYNEQDNVIATLDKIVIACGKVGCTYEIVVIDDNSSDRSLERLVAYQETHPDVPLRVYHNPMNQGLASNFTEAALRGRGKYIRIVCGDDVESVETQVAILSLMGKADIVVPYHTVVANKGWYRTFLSRTYTRLINLMSGYRMPYWNGCGLYLRYHVLRWPSNTRGFGFQALLLFKVLQTGASHVNVLCHYEERKTGKSKALTLKNWRSVIHTMLSILLRRIDGTLFKSGHCLPVLSAAKCNDVIPLYPLSQGNLNTKKLAAS